MPIDSTLFYGTPRLKVMASDLTTVLKTLYLPLTDRDGVELRDTPAKGLKTKLINGAMRYKSGGVIHNLTLTYSKYDPRTSGKGIGSGDGQTPELGDLYDILTMYENGRLLVSPCSNKEIWFAASSTGELVRKPLGKLCWADVTLEFEGHTPYSRSSFSLGIG